VTFVVTGFYRDVGEAIAWLARTFGFVENYHYGKLGGQISGAQMRLANAVVMLRSVPPGGATPQELGYGTQSLTIFLDDVDAHYQRAKAAGATIVEDLNQTAYGERQYGVIDLAGHHWLFAQHTRDLSPEEWSAKIAKT
jgi:uncharacterized glyoxalase superfamily protein PhnB